MSNTDPTRKPEVNSGAREGEAVPASYNTPTMLFVYTVNTCWIPLNAANTNDINKT